MNNSLNQGNQLNNERNTLIQKSSIEQQKLNNVSETNKTESNNRIMFMNDLYFLKNNAKNVHKDGLEKQSKMSDLLNKHINQLDEDLYVSSDDLVALNSKLNTISNKNKILNATVTIEDTSIIANIRKMINSSSKSTTFIFKANFYKTKYGYLLLYEDPDTDVYKALLENYFKKGKVLLVGDAVCVAPFAFTKFKNKWSPLPLGLENTFIFPELNTNEKPSSKLFIYNDRVNLKQFKTDEPLNYDTIQYSMNQDVQGLYSSNRKWYPGNISKINKDGTYEIKWLDEDDKDRSKNNSTLRPGYYVNQKVKAKTNNRIWKEALIDKIMLSGKYKVKWNDGSSKNLYINY